MKRRFNTGGACNPDKHYMVKLDERLKTIKEDYVDEGYYFVINRGRQYGKTTTLRALKKYLTPEYLVISMDFQGIGAEEFVSAQTFSRAFFHMFTDAYKMMMTCDRDEVLDILNRSAAEMEHATLREMFERLSRVCGAVQKPVVLMIDEVDSASNNQVFLDFLAQLRKYYIERDDKPTFHSVILAGVYDIKNLQLKVRPEAEHKQNSPWNIAADFDMDMNFSTQEIASMLQEYENEHHTGMNVKEMAELLYAYTSGYPYLVSALCKLMDEGKEAAGNTWEREGVEKAVKALLNKPTPLFESMAKQLYEHPEMKQLLYAMLFQGKNISYSADNPVIDLARMFGFIKVQEGNIQVANRIFEMRLYNRFLSEEEATNAMCGRAQADKNLFIRDGRLDMEKVLGKFVEYFTEIYNTNDDPFIEAHGRKLFLLFVKPIINGTGNYYIEAQTRDARRTDVIIDYRGEQFIIELKIWHGNEYHERGEEQIGAYLDAYRLQKGYMVSFNFNKKKNIGLKTVRIGDKIIVEAVV